MTTINTRYVDPDADVGGNGTTSALTGANCAYVSLNIWEADRQSDLVANDFIEIVECNSSDAAHTADVTRLDIDGWTTGVSNYIKIIVPSIYRHEGKWLTSKYRLDVSSAGVSALYIAEAYVRIEGIQISCPYIGIYLSDTNGEIRISNSIIVTNNGNGIYGGGNVDQNVKIWNSMLYDEGVGEYGIRSYDTRSSNWYVYNCTISGYDSGGTYSYGNVVCKNIIYYNNAVDHVNNGGTLDDTYCSTTNDNTKGLTPGGTGNRFSQTFTFIDALNYDFHLNNSDIGAIGYGLTDPGSGLFNDDINGNIRVGSWDIGADQHIEGILSTEPIFSYGELKFIVPVSSTPEPKFSYGILEILYEYYFTPIEGDYIMSCENRTFLENNKLFIL